MHVSKLWFLALALGLTACAGPATQVLIPPSTPSLRIKPAVSSIVVQDISLPRYAASDDLVVIDSNGTTITLVQVAGLIARRILCYVKPGDVLTRGQRYGFIRFGSRVDVYLPLTAQPKVAPGDKVSATTTILAVL